ncbi:thymus-specific serine protease [Echinops telfairi]|uniref:Thymus-specific serine protease n=1 Tax=Echinops telfairi TaxID=9371 RepID=A0ABM1VLJ2_ECHTE|nr:thymus-specific serine protease [Echinops telfairi]
MSFEDRDEEDTSQAGCETPRKLDVRAFLLRRLTEHTQQLQERSGPRLGLNLDPDAAVLPKEGWLEQRLDPFNASDGRVFLQAGTQLPLPSDSRLADMASAHLALSRLLNVSSSSPWICFGGSYAGSLAAWARLKIVLHSLEQKCLSTSRAETVAQLRNRDPQVSSMGDRQWLYQTCTEFGFYITCAGPGCPFSQLPTLPSQLSLCEQVFGLSISSVSQAVDQTNYYYGGQIPRATHVLFVNGDSDPWHVLSVTQSLGPLESALLIPNASHCLDMAPESSSDAPSLRLAQQYVAPVLLLGAIKFYSTQRGPDV